MGLHLNTIIWICIIIVVIALLAYIYYYFTRQVDFFRSASQTVRQKSSKKRKNLKKQREIQEEKDSPVSKQVRFKSDVSYKTFTKDPVSTPEAPIYTPSYKPHRSRKIINNYDLVKNHNSGIDELSLGTPQVPDYSITSDSSNPTSDSSIKPSIQKIKAANLEYSETEWDSGFGLPLMNPKDKAKYINQIRDNHDKYQQSIGQFGEYQMDRSTIIETDTTINPFQTGNYDGLTIADIYDKQTSGPRARAKRISRKTNDRVIYSSEDEMNGGKLQQTHLQAFDTDYAQCQTAAFGNDFNL